MEFNIITLFPEFFDGVLQSSLIRKAIDKKILTVNLIQLRDFSENKHNRVDDKVFGGGPGMLLQVGPIHRALNSLADAGHVLLTDPRGRQLTSDWAQELAEKASVTVICGNYEGVDYRVNEHLIDDAIGIGPFITNGGESVATVIMEAISRFLPGFMSKEESHQVESYDDTGQLEYPQYTRPEVYNDWPVPKVLLSGNHADIEAWRNQKRKELTEQANLLEKRLEK